MSTTTGATTGTGTAETATVGVVVVNYNGGDLTLDCLHSIVRSDWPAAHLRVVLVDNASTDGIAARVRSELPVVQVVQLDTNDGFGAGCNVGIRALGDVDCVALVNNDATVDPGWLGPLVDALHADPELGAACPKILFAGRFLEIELRSATYRRGLGDERDLGVFVAGARVDGADVWSRVQLVDGTWGLEPETGTSAGTGGEWTGPVAHLRVPVTAPASAAGGMHEVSLRLSADGPRAVSLQAGGETVEHTVGAEPDWYEVPAHGAAIEVVNNVGTERLDDGFAADRGFLQPDDGHLDAPTDVFAWCGGGVLLRRAYLDDIGLFDEDLFMYYEDLELAWRGAQRGWRYRYVPGSVVHHVHAATSVRGSALKQFYDERNRLLVLARHGTPVAATAAAARSLLVTASYARRDVVAPLLHRRRVRPDVVIRRLAAFGGFVRRLPAAISKRDRARRR
jgi:GT2 family glycosyltransferase